MLREILDKLAKNAISKSDKGDKFERLIKAYFQTDNLYKSDIKEIYLWSEFPYRNQLGLNDTGIDLVVYSNDDEYWAIQCKFYSEDKYISKSDVDTFISTSARSFLVNNKKYNFTRRYFISTTNKWSKNADAVLNNQIPTVSKISIDNLEESNVDWGKLVEGNKKLKPKKTLRNHQKEALEKTENYFKSNDRGKLIMACGTGKTYTSLKIAENQTNKNGLILFLVPSISLLGQTLREWYNESENISSICVCSDSQVTKKKNDDIFEMVENLALPATTNIEKIKNRLYKLKNKDGLKVVFSTYQSIEVIIEAQKQILKESNNKFGEFDLIICDEAHRTTGAILSDEDESSFTKVHDNLNIKGKKRIYMTATPRVYGDNIKSKAEDKDILLCTMDDETLYGKEIYRLSFGEAIDLDLLTDYKVLILTSNSKSFTKELDEVIKDESNKIKVDDVSKLIGCINGISKEILNKEELDEDYKPMKKVIAFCNTISNSKGTEYNLNNFSEKYVEEFNKSNKNKLINLEAEHVDGSMNSYEREAKIKWLNEKTEKCKILTNARCLSEGIDVPSLDGIVFMSPRNSQIDIIQSVGRVMRKSNDKKYGYVIIPVFIPDGVDIDKELDKKEYRYIWQILKAIRSHDERFDASINKLALNKGTKNNILISPVKSLNYNMNDNEENMVRESSGEQLQLYIDYSEAIKEHILVKIVDKVGDRHYFEKWAKEIGKIAKIQIDRIKKILKNKEYKAKFNEFITGFKTVISPDITEEQAIEMLSQHIITKPVFEALFEDYSFIKNNPVSKIMEDILNILLSENIQSETKVLESFYKDIRIKIGGIDNAEGKQKIIVNLYDTFFKKAFPKLVEKLGIVYTPIEVVDFIINSVEYIMKKEFKKSLSDEDVNILDPFTGTGTFITRLLQSRIIKPEDLDRKYKNEIYANEIVLLAYYIAAVNIENIYHDLSKEKKYVAFDGINLTDTFNLTEKEIQNTPKQEDIKYITENIKRQLNKRINVIIGNPPYSIGQKSANDNAANQKYDKLDNRIEVTYAAFSNSNLKKGLYDAYIKAFRWSTDRLENEDGIIAFVTNGSWLDNDSAQGFRMSLEKEFSDVYVFNLRGNQRTLGETSAKEGGKIFGSGSRTPVCITILVKNKEKLKVNKKANIYYHDIGDYLSRDEKLEIISNFNSIESIKWEKIIPNKSADWVNKRQEDFYEFIPLTPEKSNELAFFNDCFPGIVSSRDSWVYNFSEKELEKNIKKTIKFYNSELDRYAKSKENNVKDFVGKDNKEISWSRELLKKINRNIQLEYEKEDVIKSLYRPFTRLKLYYNKFLIEMPSRQKEYFREKNLVIAITGKGSKKDFSAIISNMVIDLQTIQNSQIYPLYKYTAQSGENGTLFDMEEKRGYAVSDAIHKYLRNMYGTQKIGYEDIFYYVYGFLHHKGFKEEYANSLAKEKARIPIVKNYDNFEKISKCGHKLADLHLNYETIDIYKDVVVSDSSNYVVNKMKFNSKKDKSTIIYNSSIKISNIPEKAYQYIVNGKSAIEWIIEKYQVSIDKKTEIKNDPNNWSIENNNPRYILDLLLKIINVSVQSVDIIEEISKVEYK